MQAPDSPFKVLSGVTFAVALTFLLAALAPGNQGQEVATGDANIAGPQPQEPLVLQLTPSAQFIDNDSRLLGLQSTLGQIGEAQVVEVDEFGEPIPTGPDTDPQTFYVSPSGNDGNDGQTPEQPWQNLQGALDRLEPGQTLYLMDGTYTGGYAAPPAHWIVRRSGTPDAWIRVAAAYGHTPVLHPNKGHGLEVRNARYVEVRGLTVVGQTFGKGDNDYGWGMVIRESHDVRLLGNDISAMPSGGISAVESDRFEILKNNVHHNSFWGPEQGSGISVWNARSHNVPSFDDGYHIRIVGNTSFSNENKVYSIWYTDRSVMTDGNGIIMDEGRHFGYTNRVLIANNISYDNGGRGINVTKSSHVDIIHNTTYHNGKTQTLSTPGTEFSATWSNDIRFINNFGVSRSGLNEIMLSEAYEVVTEGNVFVTDSPSGKTNSGNFITQGDPRFKAASIDPAVADFHLNSGSVAIGKGAHPAPTITEDRDGATRPSDTASDAGAYQHR